ncbi:MAG: polar amino acid transport system substrate-binding protein [Alphaproteobacteria bacterium]|jgi:polar amino acid transport system substrate-binding protein
MKTRLLPLLFLLAACSPASEKDEAANSLEQIEPTAAVAPVTVEEQLAAVEECKLTLGFDAWEPYQYADVGGRVAGLDIELISGVVEQIGCELTYQQGTWVDLLAALRKGDIDMLLGASKTEAREQFAFFSDAYRMEEFSLYIRKDDQGHAVYESLSEFIADGSKIGIVADYFYGEEVAELLDDPEKSKSFINAIMGELNVARLLDEDIAGFLEDSFVGASMLRRKALSEYIVAHGITIQTGDAYVMFSRQGITENQLSRFNVELRNVKKSTKYQELLTKYSY